jgi:hypothetical protein
MAPKGKGKEKDTAPQTLQTSTRGGSRIQTQSAQSSTHDQARVLWCLIDGDLSPFKVIVPINCDMSYLRDLVRVRGINMKTDVLARDLILWKVRVF